MARNVRALDPAIGQAQGAGGVGIDGVAEGDEAGGGQLLGSAVGRRLDLVIPLLAHGAGVGVDGQDVLDQRIGRGLDGGQAAFPQGAAHGRVSQLGASDQTRRQGLGAFLAQQGADIGAVDGQPFAGLGQPPFQSDLL
ncbi:hypothetical protein D3C81_1722300 [compost metagenome]